MKFYKKKSKDIKKFYYFYKTFYSFPSDLFISSRVKKKRKQRLIFSTKIYFSKQFIIKQSQIIRFQEFIVYGMYLYI